MKISHVPLASDVFWLLDIFLCVTTFWSYQFCLLLVTSDIQSTKLFPIYIKIMKEISRKYLTYVSQDHSQLHNEFQLLHVLELISIRTKLLTFIQRATSVSEPQDVKLFKCAKRDLKENRKLSLDILRAISTCTDNVFPYNPFPLKREALLLYCSSFLFYIRYQVLMDLMMFWRWCSATAVLSVGLS